MRIEENEVITRWWLDDTYAIHKHRDSNLYVLEYYRFGTNHMPDEIYYDETYERVYKVYERYTKMIG